MSVSESLAMSVLFATPPVSFFSGSTSSTSSVRATLALLLEDDAKLQVSSARLLDPP